MPVPAPVKCPVCGSAPAAEALFCHRCGAHLALGARRKVAPCTACGHGISATAVKCPYCGAMEWSPLAWALVFASLSLGSAIFLAPYAAQPWLRGLLRWGVGSLGVVLALVELAWVLALLRPSLASLTRRRNVKGLAAVLRSRDGEYRAAAAQALVSLGWQPADDTTRKWLGLEGAPPPQAALVD